MHHGLLQARRWENENHSLKTTLQHTFLARNNRNDKFDFQGRCRMGALDLLKTECDEKLAKAQLKIDRLTCDKKRLTQHMKMQQAELDAYTESPLGKRVGELEANKKSLLILTELNILSSNRFQEENNNLRKRDSKREDLLKECASILAENNWRGDLQELIKDFLSPSNN